MPHSGSACGNKGGEEQQQHCQHVEHGRETPCHAIEIESFEEDASHTEATHLDKQHNGVLQNGIP